MKWYSVRMKDFLHFGCVVSQGLDGHYYDIGNMPDIFFRRDKIKE